MKLSHASAWSAVVLAAVITVSFAAQNLVYRDGDSCFDMQYYQCYECNSLGMAITCHWDDDEDEADCRRMRSCSDDDEDYTDVVSVPCAYLPQCGIGYQSAEVDGFDVESYSSDLHVQRLSSSEAGILLLEQKSASFLGALRLLLYGTVDSALFYKRSLSNGTYYTNVGSCQQDDWCSAPGGLSYMKYTAYYNDSHSGVIYRSGEPLSPFSARLLPTRSAEDSRSNLMLDIESTPVRISVTEGHHFWLSDSYITTELEGLDDVSLQLTPRVGVSQMSYDPVEEELSFLLNVAGNERNAVNTDCRLLGKYEDSTVSRCDFSFERSFSAGFSYLDSSYFSSYFSFSRSHRWMGDEAVEDTDWNSQPAFSLFD